MPFLYAVRLPMRMTVPDLRARMYGKNAFVILTGPAKSVFITYIIQSVLQSTISTQRV